MPMFDGEVAHTLWLGELARAEVVQGRFIVPRDPAPPCSALSVRLLGSLTVSEDGQYALRDTTASVPLVLSSPPTMNEGMVVELIGALAPGPVVHVAHLVVHEDAEELCKRRQRMLEAQRERACADARADRAMPPPVAPVAPPVALAPAPVAHEAALQAAILEAVQQAAGGIVLEQIVAHCAAQLGQAVPPPSIVAELERLEAEFSIYRKRELFCAM